MKGEIIYQVLSYLTNIRNQANIRLDEKQNLIVWEKVMKRKQRICVILYALSTPILFLSRLTQEHFSKTDLLSIKREITVYSKILMLLFLIKPINSPCHLHSCSNKGIGRVEHSNTSWKSHVLPSVNPYNTIYDSN